MPKRKTPQQFVKEVYHLVGNDYTFLENYVNSSTKIKVRHNKCGNIYKVNPNNFLRGSRCPKCSPELIGLKNTKTIEQFKKEVHDLVGNEYTVLGKYKNNKTKIKIKHNTCGYIYSVTPDHFLSGIRCPICTKKEILKQKDTEFKNEVYDLVGNEYMVLEEYKGSHGKIKIRHEKCGHEYYVKPSNFLRGNRCPKCSMKIAGIKKTKTTGQFKQKVYELVGEEYSVLGEYIKRAKKIKIKHNKCGHIYEVTPDSFIQGIRCPICTKEDRLKQKDTEFKQKVFNLTGNEYEVLSKYKNTNTKIRMKHNKCGHIYEVRPNNFLQGSRCPICKASKGEEKIAKYLTKFGIKYETQKTFDDLKYKNVLKFDFYLPIQKMCIEYDGEQHFRPVNFGGISNDIAEENFKNQKIRDKLKDEYCKENNVNLFRIKYTDFKDIKKILKNTLK